MVQAVDYLLVTLYIVSILCCGYIIVAHMPYYKDRVKSGVVNLFMVAMLFFLTAYLFKMVTVLWIRSGVILDWSDTDLRTLQLYAWTLAQIGTTIGLVSLAVLTRTKRFDMFIYLRKVDKGAINDESNSN